MPYTDVLYPNTGATKKAVDSGQTTRHYASDGSSPTHDWEVVGFNWANYEATCQQNIPGDELSIKVWGPAHRIDTLIRYQYGLMEIAAGIYFK